MQPDDVAMTAFGVCCRVFGFESMLFGLKNAGETYQNMMAMGFKEQFKKNIAVHVYDMLVKSQRLHNT